MCVLTLCVCVLRAPEIHLASIFPVFVRVLLTVVLVTYIRPLDSSILYHGSPVPFDQHLPTSPASLPREPPLYCLLLRCVHPQDPCVSEMVQFLLSASADNHFQLWCLGGQLELRWTLKGGGAEFASHPAVSLPAAWNRMLSGRPFLLRLSGDFK